MSKSLVTGGAGFIGSHLVDLLIEAGHEVVVVDNLSTGSEDNINPLAKLYQMDIRDAKISEIFKQEMPDFVFHFAAQINVRDSVNDPISNAETNILGSLNVIENAVKYNVKKFIFASTGGAIYGEAEQIPTAEDYHERPLSPYGINKLSIEKSLFFYKEVKGLDYAVLRLSNVYGPRQNSRGEAGVVAIFINKILEGGQPTISGDGKQTRDYVFVRDAARAFLLAQGKIESEKFNISTGIETDVNMVFDKILEKMEVKLERKYCEARPGEQKRSCLDFSLAKKELGWIPEYDFDRGLSETVDWFKSKAK
jgi:UDP-glucose 4-epimerase